MTSLESYIKEYYQQILKRLKEMEADLNIEEKSYLFNVAILESDSIFVI